MVKDVKRLRKSLDAKWTADIALPADIVKALAQAEKAAGLAQTAEEQERVKAEMGRISDWLREKAKALACRIATKVEVNDEIQTGHGPATVKKAGHRGNRDITVEYACGQTVIISEDTVIGKSNSLSAEQRNIFEAQQRFGGWLKKWHEQVKTDDEEYLAIIRPVVSAMLKLPRLNLAGRISVLSVAEGSVAQKAVQLSLNGRTRSAICAALRNRIWIRVKEVKPDDGEEEFQNIADEYLREHTSNFEAINNPFSNTVPNLLREAVECFEQGEKQKTDED